MPIDIRFESKIRFNGREYDGVEAMPADERRLYELATASLGPGRAATVIELNGRRYERPEDMPAAERALYESILTVAARRARPEGEAPNAHGPVRAEPLVTPRAMAILVGAAAALLALAALALSR